MLQGHQRPEKGGETTEGTSGLEPIAVIEDRLDAARIPLEQCAQVEAHFRVKVLVAIQ